ncbi:MAG TPA: PDZ domain-containing protein [Candidatus Paceibacterota bacterium]|nr:PDZ domain-containing protein [Candidatus Paceibacterota bacterium]
MKLMKAFGAVLVLSAVTATAQEPAGTVAPVSRDTLVELATLLSEDTAEDGHLAARIRQVDETFTFTGIGVSFSYETRWSRDRSSGTAYPVVDRVYTDSGAQHAGIRPGDRIISVNGDAVGEVRFSPAGQVGDVKVIAELVAASPSPVPLIVERDGKRFTASALKGRVRREVPPYVSANLALWTASLGTLRPDAAAFGVRVSSVTDGDAPEFLQELWREGMELRLRSARLLANIGITEEDIY